MGWTVCANCKGRGKTGCPPLMYATVERRAKMLVVVAARIRVRSGAL